MSCSNVGDFYAGGMIIEELDDAAGPDSPIIGDPLRIRGAIDGAIDGAIEEAICGGPILFIDGGDIDRDSIFID